MLSRPRRTGRKTRFYARCRVCGWTETRLKTENTASDNILHYGSFIIFRWKSRIWTVINDRRLIILFIIPIRIWRHNFLGIIRWRPLNRISTHIRINIFYCQNHFWMHVKMTPKIQIHLKTPIFKAFANISIFTFQIKCKQKMFFPLSSGEYIRSNAASPPG